MTYEHGFIAEVWFQKTIVFFVFQLEVYSAFLTLLSFSNNSSEAALLVPVIVLFVKRDHKLIALPSAHPGLNCAKKRLYDKYSSLFPEHGV